MRDAVPEERRFNSAGWTPHNGYEMPVDGRAIIEVLTDDAKYRLAPRPAEHFNWSERGASAINYYRVVTPAPTEPASVPADTLTIRDQFAMAALPAVINVFDTHRPEVATRENFATEAYRIADAMLAERAKK